MLMSMFSSFDALGAESFGQKVGFSGTPSCSKEGKVVDAAAPASSKVAPSPLTSESVSKCKVVGNSSEPQAADGRKQKAQLRRTDRKSVV